MNRILPAADIELEIGDLDEGAARALLALRAEQMRHSGALRTDTGAPILVWTLGEESFALPMADVALVLPAGRTTPVPDAPAALVGVAARRGRLLNLVDPGPALGVSPGPGEHWLVLTGTSPRLALRVDRVEEVAALPPGPVAAVDGLTRPVVRADGRRVSLVDKSGLIGAMGLADRQGGE